MCNLFKGTCKVFWRVRTFMVYTPIDGQTPDKKVTGNADLRQETRQLVGVKVQPMDLKTYLYCPLPSYTLIQCRSITTVALVWWYTPIDGQKISKIWPKIWGKRTANKWPQKCDGGPYNGADSVHWPFIYIYIKELPIYKKEIDACLCALVIHCRTAGSISKIWPILRHENRQQVATKMWWRALQWCW